MLVHNLSSAQILLNRESSVNAKGEPCPRPAVGAATPGGGTAPPAGGGTPATSLYAVTYRIAPNPASEDFAKQLLVLIGTLVTSVAGFYFGAKAVADAQDSGGAGPPPTLLGVTPTVVQRGGDPQQVNITGSNLNSATQAQIVSGNVRITDPNVVSNPGQVQAHFLIRADAPLGTWDVVVTDAAGQIARLAGGLTVTDPQVAAPAKPALELTGVDPPKVPRGGEPVVLKISGSDLALVNHARLETGSAKIQGENLLSNATVVQAQFTVAADAPLGHWDVVVEDSCGRAGKLSDAFLVEEPGPKLTSPVDPPGAPRAQGKVTIKLTGDHLGLVNAIQLILGDNRIPGTNVLSSDTTAQAEFDIPSNAPAGKWDVEVTDSSDRTDHLQGAFELT